MDEPDLEEETESGVEGPIPEGTIESAPASSEEPGVLEPLPSTPAAPPTAPSVEPPPAESFEPEPFPESEDPAGSGAQSGGFEGEGLIGEGFTPFQLSYLAIAGGLREEGIPGGDRLISAYKDGELSAADIVSAGEASNRLGTAAIDKEDYTQDVDRFLKIFRRDARTS